MVMILTPGGGWLSAMPTPSSKLLRSIARMEPLSTDLSSSGTYIDRTANHWLMEFRNPWGKRANAAMGEWTGPWSDGSSEWNPYWMKKLDHTFGDDGLFWMSYEDLLKRFDLLDRTRLFDHNWTIVQQWTSVPVGWVTGFLNTKFSFEVKKQGTVVVQLCQVGRSCSLQQRMC